MTLANSSLDKAFLSPTRAYGTNGERPTSRTPLEVAILPAGEAPSGTIGPKIESAIPLADQGGAVITSPEPRPAAVRGDAGPRTATSDAP